MLKESIDADACGFIGDGHGYDGSSSFRRTGRRTADGGPRTAEGIFNLPLGGQLAHHHTLCCRHIPPPTVHLTPVRLSSRFLGSQEPFATVGDSISPPYSRSSVSALTARQKHRRQATEREIRYGRLFPLKNVDLHFQHVDSIKRLDQN